MIASFRSRALQRYWQHGDVRGLRRDMVERIADRLAILHVAEELEDANVPGAGFHPLRGKPQRYALKVNKNWRITFVWNDGLAFDVDLEDYH